jgi:hypothetical protein
MRQSATRPVRKSKRKALLESLNDLLSQMPSLLDIDHPCAQKQIMEARKVVEVFKIVPSNHCFELIEQKTLIRLSVCCPVLLRKLET